MVSAHETAKRPSARERLIASFLTLAQERGLDGLTTREIAAHARTNEVTLFRHFGDKQGLVRAAFASAGLASRLDSLPHTVDVSSVAATETSLVQTLRAIRALLAEHRGLVVLGIGELSRHPGLSAVAGEAPDAASALLCEILRAAAPRLRPEVDVEAEMHALMGAILLSVLWEHVGWLPDEASAWPSRARALIRPLLALPNDGGR